MNGTTYHPSQARRSDTGCSNAIDTSALAGSTSADGPLDNGYRTVTGRAASRQEAARPIDCDMVNGERLGNVRRGD